LLKYDWLKITKVADQVSKPCFNGEEVALLKEWGAPTTATFGILSCRIQVSYQFLI